MIYNAHANLHGLIGPQPWHQWQNAVESAWRLSLSGDELQNAKGIIPAGERLSAWNILYHPVLASGLAVVIRLPVGDHGFGTRKRNEPGKSLAIQQVQNGKWMKMVTVRLNLLHAEIDSGCTLLI